MSNLVTSQAVDRFTHAYMTAALWSEVDAEGNPLDDGRDTSDISHLTKIRMRADCVTFLKNAARLFEEGGFDMWEQTQAPDGHFYDLWEQAGHDLWLTRNGHGSGFWDRPQIWGDFRHSLANVASAMPRVDLEVGDDGLVHGLDEGDGHQQVNFNLTLTLSLPMAWEAEEIADFMRATMGEAFAQYLPGAVNGESPVNFTLKEEAEIYGNK